MAISRISPHPNCPKPVPVLADSKVRWEKNRIPDPKQNDHQGFSQIISSETWINKEFTSDLISR